MAPSALAFRVVALVSIFFAGLGGAALPFVVSSRYPRVLGLLNAAAAGVFMAASLVHLLDDAEQNPGLRRWSEVDDGRYAFPWAPAFCLAGFLLLLVVGEVRQAPPDSVAALLGSPRDEGFPTTTADNSNSSTTSGVQSAKTGRPRRGSEHGEFSHIDSYDPEGDGAANASAASLTAVVVFAALSVHSVLAGLPLGAQGATPGAYGLYVAIMAHKSLAAFALGSNFVTAGSSFSKGAIRCYLFCFAMMTPAGIGAGWVIASLAEGGEGGGGGDDAAEGSGSTAEGTDVGEDSAAVGLLSAVASGTFLYVATMELLPDALARGEREADRLGTNLAIVAGAVAFGSLARWT